jgi:phage-related minor tail protein
MQEEKIARMYEYLGSPQDPRTASVKMSADEMLQYLDYCFYGPPGPRYGLGRQDMGDPKVALSYLEALKKLKYDGKAIAAMAKYFKAMVAAEDLRSDASRALGTLQDMRYSRGDKAREKEVATAR